MLGIIFDVVVIIGNDMRPSPVTIRLSALARARCYGLLFSLAVSPAFCRFFLRNRCLWILFSQISAKAVVSAILISSINGLLMTLHLLAETAARCPGTVAVIIDRVSADRARARWRSAGGALMTDSEASTHRRSVDTRGRVADLNWRCAVLERF